VQQGLSRCKRAFHNPERNERKVRINASACESVQRPEPAFRVDCIPAGNAPVSLSYHSGL